MIAQNIESILDELPQGVKLVAVSKFQPLEALLEAYAMGQRCFGENRPQEFAAKAVQMPQDVEWHFIGHLQTNKVRFIVPYISMIEAVDSLRLMKEIEKQAARCDKVVDCLLELHIAEEATKYGLSLDDCRQLLHDGEWRTMSHLRIRGLMMRASFTDDEQQIRREMTTAADFFDEVKRDYFADDEAFALRSWGMSDDFPIALQCRSNMIRVGTRIFGPRKY